MRRVELKVIVETSYGETELEYAVVHEVGNLPGVHRIQSFDARELRTESVVWVDNPRTGYGFGSVELLWNTPSECEEALLEALYQARLHA